MNDAFVDQIGELSREEALEALLSLRADIYGKSPSDSEGAAVLEAFRTDPFSQLDDMDALVRLALFTLAADPRHADAVEGAVRGVGRKAFVFGSAEILMGVGLALYGLQLYLTRGKVKEEEEIQIEPRRIIIRRRLQYGVTKQISDLLSRYLSG